MSDLPKLLKIFKASLKRNLRWPAWPGSILTKAAKSFFLGRQFILYVGAWRDAGEEVIRGNVFNMENLHS